MAKNSLGKLENAPGAHRAELAHYTGEVADLHKQCALLSEKIGQKYLRAARTSKLKGYLAGVYNSDELSVTEGAYYSLARRQRNAGNAAMNEALEHNGATSALAKEASKYSRVSKIQIALSRIGITLG